MPTGDYPRLLFGIDLARFFSLDYGVMKIILYRYLMREQILPISICFLGLSLVLITGRLMQLTQYLFTSSLTSLDLLEIIAFAMPKLVLYTLPMATLIGVLLAFIRLNNDNELIAFRTAGISFLQLAPPVVIMLIFITVASSFNTLYLMPIANKAFKHKLLSMGRASLPALLKEGIFIDAVPGMVFFFQKVNPTELAIKGVFIQDRREKQIITIVGERADISYQQDHNHLSFLIKNGIVTRVGDDLAASQAVSFRSYELTLALDEILDSSIDGSKGWREMSLGELYRMVQRGPAIYVTRFELELHHRFALPISCLLLGLLSVPLGTLFHQRSRMTGITLGLGAFLAYYVVLSAGKGLADAFFIPAWLAAWLPNIVTAIITSYLWKKSQQETPFGFIDFWQRIKPASGGRKAVASSANKARPNNR